MSDAPLARLVLLVIDEQRSRVLVDGGALPVRERPLRPDEGALTPAWTDWSEFALPGPLLDTVLDPTRGRGGNEPYTSLVVLEAPLEGASLPNGWTWRSLDDPNPEVESGLADVMRRRLDEARGEREVPAGRPRWCRSGWRSRVDAWIETQLVARGRAAPTAITPLKTWGISTVLRVDAPDGRSWLKASFPPFGHEGLVTDRLHRAMPSRVPLVLAIEPDEHWVLLDDLGDPSAGDLPPIESLAADITDIHVATREIADDLLAIGCPDRPIGALPEAVATALRSEVAQRHVDSSPAQSRRIVDAVTEAVAHAESIGVPSAIIHADLHRGNLICTEDGPIVFDWTDACRSHPLVDVTTWTEEFRDDEERVGATWAAFRDAWVDRFGVAWFEPDVRRLEIVGQAFLLDSYVKILSAIERDRHRECSAGITEATTRLEHLITQL